MLPQQVTDQMSRAPVQTPGISGQLLMFCTFLFIVSLIFYLGLNFGYKPIRQSQLDELRNELKSFQDKIKQEDKSRVITLYSQIQNLKDPILLNHVEPSPFFDWLEKNTQVNVFFGDMHFDVAKGEISLKATGKSMNDVSEQVFQLQKLVNQGSLKKITITNTAVGEKGIVGFNLSLLTGPNFFKQITELPQP